MTPPFPTRRSSDLVRLSDHDVDLLEGALRSARDDLHRVQLHFALGKALGDLSRSELSFRQYQKANDIRRKLAPYSAMDGVVRQTEAIFTPEFLAGRKDLGLGGSEAIFIVGMPRSGRSEEHTSELQSLMRISYAVFCLKKKINNSTY